MPHFGHPRGRSPPTPSASRSGRPATASGCWTAFFEYGRLKAIPAQRKKERICLEEIAKELELGRPYPERELNQVLLRFHQDYCTLRRDMISEGILCREEGLYTRLV